MRSKIMGRLLLSASAMVMAAGGAAHAQDNRQAAAKEVDELVVTGSRLATGATSPQPLTVLGQEVIAQKAPSTILEAVNEIPAFRQSSGVTNSLRGTMSGQLATVDLRGLGSNRTLTLVNGLRQAGPLGLGFDTNAIPTQLVKRVEVVTGGASAAYGSDAVAGVVNFILDDDIEGVRGQVMVGRSQYGDDDRAAFDLAGGMHFAGDRGHIMGGLNYTYGGGVGNMYQRDWGRREPGILAQPATRPAGTPANTYAYGVEWSDRTPGGLVTTVGPLRNISFGTGSSLMAFNPGTAFSTNMTGSISNYGYGNSGTLFPLVGAIERKSALGRATFEITPDIEVFADATYMTMQSEGYFGNNTQAFIVSRDNPYMPAEFRAMMVANNLQTVTINKLLTQFNPDPSKDTGAAVQTLVDNTYRQANAGVKGKLFDRWEWDIAASWGEYEVDQTFAGVPMSANLLAAGWVVADASGQPICGPIATNPNLTAAQRLVVDAGCSPFNVFGINTASPAAMAYVRRATRNLSTRTLTSYQANIRGDVVDLWAGPLAMAVGVEHRIDEYETSGNGVTVGASAFFGGTNTAPFSGESKVTEGYVEAHLPLLKDMVVKSLDLDLAARRTSYSNSGEVTTWKVGLSSEVNDWLRLRATRSRDIRAPTVTELYTPGGGIAFVQNSLNPFKGTTGTLFTTGGGNPNLLPEVSDTLTAGVVFQPHWGWTEGFSVSVDYYDFELTGVIATAGSAQDTVNRCFNGNQAFCSLITFDNSAFGIALVRTAVANQNALNYNGVDIEVNYAAPEGFLNLPGQLSARYLASWVDDQELVEATGLATDRAGNAISGLPEWSMTGSVTYDFAPFSTTLTARYFNDVKANTSATALGPNDPNYNPSQANTFSQNLWKGQVYFNWAGSFDLVEPEPGRRIQLFGVIDNLLNTQPPDFFILQSSGVGQANLFDLIGRRFRAGVRFAF